MARDPNRPDPKDRKKIMFWESPRRQVNLKIRLELDGFTQSHFFRAIITGYLEKDENILKYIDDYKEKSRSQGIAKRKIINKNLDNAKKIENKFALNKNEIEDIFDIIAEEFPEL